MKKRRFVGLLALLSCATLTAGCSLSDLAFWERWTKNDQSQTDSESDPVLQSISVSNPKTEYTVGDEFEKPTVIASFDKGDPQNVTNNASFAGYDISAAGNYTVTVSYSGKTTSYSITVNAPKPKGEIIIGDIPTHLDPGKKLDLDNYVTLVRLSSFDLTLDSGSDVASLEGHVITINGEGHIKFTVSSGDLAYSFEIDTIYGGREFITSYFEGVKKNYDVAVYMEEDDGSWPLSDYLVHSDLFLLSMGSWDEDSSGNPIPGGFLKFSEDDVDAYTYHLEEDPETKEYNVVLDDETFSMMLNYYNSDLGVDFSTIAHEYDKSGNDMFVLYEKEAMEFAENSLLVPDGAYGSNGEYPFTRIEFKAENIGTEEEPEMIISSDNYVLYHGKNELVSKARYFVDPEEIGFAEVEAFCIPENEPEHFDYYNKAFEDDGLTVSDFFPSNESKLGNSGMMILDYGWVDDEGETIEQPSSADNFFGAVVPSGSKTWYVSETSIFEVEEAMVPDQQEEDPETTYIPVSGKMAHSVGDEDPQTIIYSIFSGADGYFAEPDYSCETVWDDSKLSFAALRAESSYSDGALMSQEQVSVYAENDGYKFEFKPGKAHDVFYSLCDGSPVLSIFPETIEWYAGVTGGDNLEIFFDYELVIVPSVGLAQINITFNWDTNASYSISFSSILDESIAAYNTAFEEYLAQYCK